MRHVPTVDGVVFARDVELFSGDTRLLDRSARSDLIIVVQGRIDMPGLLGQLQGARDNVWGVRMAKEVISPPSILQRTEHILVGV